MKLAELLPALQQLPRSDKLRAIQFLSTDLALEDSTRLADGAQYPVWSPHDAVDAAAVLSRFAERPADGS